MLRVEYLGDIIMLNVVMICLEQVLVSFPLFFINGLDAI